MPKLNVPGMSCGHCKMSIENALAELDFVRAVNVNLDEKTVAFELTDEAQLDAVINQIEDIGYDVVR